MDAAITPSAASQATGLFVRNMAALWRTDAALAQQLDDLPDSLLADLVPSKAGPPTFAATAPDGRTVWLHSRYDPRKQAEQFAQNLDPEKPAVVLTGMGLGYTAEAIGTHQGPLRPGRARAGPGYALCALHCVDLSKAIRDSRLALMTTEEPDDLHRLLEPQNLLLMAGTQIAVFDPCMQVAGDFHKRLSQRITDYVAYVNMSFRTIFANARVTAANVANNLPTYLATPPIDILKGRFAGCPGILVAAGPSLRKHLDMLAQLRGRAAILLRADSLQDAAGAGHRAGLRDQFGLQRGQQAVLRGRPGLSRRAPGG